MALSTATISYNLADMVGSDFDVSDTRVWVTTNVEGGAVIDTVGNAVRLGDGTGSLASDGTGSLNVWVPGAGSNPASWQTTVHVMYSPRINGWRPIQRDFGPFTVTANADLADLVAEQEVPPTYLSTVTGLLDGYVDDAQAAQAAAAASAAAAQALVLSDLGTTDGQTKALIQNPASQTAGALAATFVPQWKASAVVAANEVRMAPAGQTIKRIAAGTTRSSYDSTEAALWTVVSSGGGVVYHGTNADYVRPAISGAVIWIGAVRPVNMVGGDVWLVSSTQTVAPPVSWFIDYDASTLALSDLAQVASWTDRSGNARHATQATLSKRPIFHVAAGDQPAFVRFDGVDDILTTGALTAIPQPFSLVVALRMTTVTNTATAQVMVSSAASGATLTDLQQRAVTAGTTPRWEIFGGNSGNGFETDDIAVAGQWVVLTCIFNGASSKIRVNGVQRNTTGNIGTNTISGLSLGALTTGASYSAVDLYAVKLIAGSVTTITDVERALMDAIGIA